MMADYYAKVSFEGSSIEDIRQCVLDFLGTKSVDGTATTLGLFIEVVNSRDDYTYARDFLAREGLHDDNPMWQQLDRVAFSIDVLVHGPWRSSLVVVVADALAQHVTKALNLRATIELSEGDVPFVLYENGVVARDFREEYERFFEHLRWRPSSIT